jgi:Arc/MetJ-type ribon-helix-helix transcriptional regulator
MISSEALLVLDREVPISQAAQERQQRTLSAKKALQRSSRLIESQKLPFVPTTPEGIGQEPGVYMVAENSRMPEIRGYELQGRAALSGMVDSKHAVMVVDMDLREDGKATTKEVAAKHYSTRSLAERVERVQMEVSVMKDLQRRGMPTFNPVSVVVAPPSGDAPGGDVLLFTEFDPSVFTLDNFAWGRGCTEGNIAMAEEVLGALGEFNTLGYRHKDAKVKNVAQNEVGRMAMIDFETTEAVDHQKPFEAAVTVNQDFATMINSLVDRGFFRSASPLLRQSVIERLATSYTQQWEGASGEVQNVVLETVVDVGHAIDASL